MKSVNRRTYWQSQGVIWTGILCYAHEHHNVCLQVISVLALLADFGLAWDYDRSERRRWYK